MVRRQMATKKRNPQDETVGQRKRTTDALRARIARIERVLRAVHPIEWRRSKEPR